MLLNQIIYIYTRINTRTKLIYSFLSYVIMCLRVIILADFIFSRDEFIDQIVIV